MADWRGVQGEDYAETRGTDSSSTKTRERGGSCRGWEMTSRSLPWAAFRVTLVESMEGWSHISL